MPRFLIVYDTKQGETSEILVGTRAQLQDRLEKLQAGQPATDLGPGDQRSQGPEIPRIQEEVI